MSEPITIGDGSVYVEADWDKWKVRHPRFLFPSAEFREIRVTGVHAAVVTGMEPADPVPVVKNIEITLHPEGRLTAEKQDVSGGRYVIEIMGISRFTWVVNGADRILIGDPDLFIQTVKIDDHLYYTHSGDSACRLNIELTTVP
jgi:hypothetical protein